MTRRRVSEIACSRDVLFGRTADGESPGRSLTLEVADYEHAAVRAPVADRRVGRRRPGDTLMRRERAELALDVGEGTEHERLPVAGAAPQDSRQLDVGAAGDGKHV